MDFRAAHRFNKERFADICNEASRQFEPPRPRAILETLMRADTPPSYEGGECLERHLRTSRNPVSAQCWRVVRSAQLFNELFEKLDGGRIVAFAEQLDGAFTQLDGR